MDDKTVTDRLALEDIASQVDRAVDAKCWDELAAYFYDPILVDMGDGPVELRRADFIGELAAINPADKLTGHTRSNNVTHVRGDTATLWASSYGWNECRRFDPPAYEVWGEMEYGFTRDDSRWRITRLRLRKRREAGNPDVNRYRA